MKDKDGFAIQCKYSDWKVIDEQWNHDFVCTRFFQGGTHYCYEDEHCKYYEPVKKEDQDV